MAFEYPSLPWLLEPDNPGVRFLALKDLVELPSDNPELKQANKEAYTNGPIAEILKKMNPDGYWEKPGPGYGPKYYSIVWSLITLSMLGASADDDKRIAKACEYYLDHAISENGSITYNGKPHGYIDCLSGNMCAALTALGYNDERLDIAFDWMARTITGDSVKYYAYKSAPGFACGANGKRDCAWGAVKTLLAFGKLPASKRTPAINQAIDLGVKFIFSTDPQTAMYPTTNNMKPSGNWWKFGFPVFYITDLLQLAEALVSLGYGHDKRLKKSLDYIKQKQDDQGRWLLEYHYHSKIWNNFGKKGQPNKWVTYRALKILKEIQS